MKTILYGLRELILGIGIWVLFFTVVFCGSLGLLYLSYKLWGVFI